MSRLILVPQYPAKLRYQEWWREELPTQYGLFFDEVEVLGPKVSLMNAQAEAGLFSPIEQAVHFELVQVNEYMNMKLREDDVLLLCDLSFPGFFTNALMHRRPARSYAICHATSRNVYDYFSGVWRAKWPIETGSAHAYEKVFVATQYHKDKLGWSNAMVTGLPFLPADLGATPGRLRQSRGLDIVSVARDHPQKRDPDLEQYLENQLGVQIQRPPSSTQSWDDYFSFLSKAKVMLITAREETFGYQVIDAVHNGCLPLAPAKFSYPELLSPQYLYQDKDDMVEKAARMVRWWEGYWEEIYPLHPQAIKRSNLFYWRTAAEMKESI